MTLRSVQVAIGVFLVNIPLAFLLFAAGLYIAAVIVILTGTVVIYAIAFNLLEF